MSAVIRAGGSNFDVDVFLPGCTLPVCNVFRRGEPVYPWSKLTEADPPTAIQAKPHPAIGSTYPVRYHPDMPNQPTRLCLGPLNCSGPWV